MGNILKTEGGLVINRPGNVMFVPIKADKTEDYANAVRNTAKINTITITNSKTKTEIPDGNAFYPAGDRVTAITGTVAIEFSTVDPTIWALSSGTSVKNTTGDTMLKIYEYEKIGEDNKIELSDEYKTNGFIQVIGADGTEYEKVTSAPTAGEYSIAVANGVTKLTFASADASKSVGISMTIVADTMSYSQGRKAMKNYKIIIDTDMSLLDNSTDIGVNYTISQASISGDMVDALQKDPSATKTLTYNMYAPLPGEQPYEVKMQNKATGEEVSL